ncbi:MAG: carboxymuconolactone decarboxylase family protein [Novosphingobium sp.]|nr:carboxymuconolactone decarboxylase family protein [Novosphingobium sp.]
MGEEFDKGLALFREVYGDDMADGLVSQIEAGTDFGPNQSLWTLEWAYGSLWTREGLDRKLRSCAVLGMLIGQGQVEEIKFHTIMALANGLTRTEIEEIFYTAIPYAGFPAANSAKKGMLEALDAVEAAGK